MKGISQGIQSYLFVLVALVVGTIMLVLVSRYSSVFSKKNDVINITGDERDISESLSKIIRTCWENNRRGLEEDSTTCQEVVFENELTIEERGLVNYLDCIELPDANCYLYPDMPLDYDCGVCSSPYFTDNDKIIWLAEPENEGVKIKYDGGDRKIVVVGFPCDNQCMCERSCKRNCIKGLPDCQGCYNNC